MVVAGLKAHAMNRRKPKLIGYITVPIHQISDPSWKSGALNMTFADTTLKLEQEGKEIASVSGCIAAVTQITIKRRVFQIDPREVLLATNELLSDSKRDVRVRKACREALEKVTKSE